MSASSDILLSRQQQEFNSALIADYNNDFEQLYQSLSKQLNNYLRTDLKEAHHYIQQISKIARFFPVSQRYRGYALEARYHSWAGSYKQAMSGYNNALALTVKSKNSKASALLRKAMVEVAMYCGEYDQALEFGRTAASYFKRSGDTNNYAQTVTNIGNVYHRMDRNKQALANYDKAATIFDKDGGVPSAIVTFNKANIFTNLNQVRQAEKLYKQAAKIYASANLTLAHQHVVYSLAYLYFLESRFSEAIQLFDTVYASFENLGDKKAAVITLLDIIELNVEINQYGSAVMLGETVIPELRKMKMTYEEAKANYFIAKARLALGDLKSGLKLLRRSEQLFTKEGNYLWVGMASVLRAETALAKHRYTDAVRYAKDAAGKFSRSGDARRKIDADLVEIKALFSSRKANRAERIAQRVSKQPMTLAQKSQLEEILGSYSFENKQYTLAKKHFEKAIRAVEKQLETFEPDEIRFFFALDKYSVYTKYINTLLHLNDVKKSYVTNLNALQLLLQKQYSEKRIRAELSEQDTRRLVELRTRLQKLYTPPRGSQRFTVQHEDARRIEHQIWQIQKKRKYINNNALNITKQYQDDKLPRLNSSEMVINYLELEDQLVAFTNTADKVSVITLPVTPEQLHNLVRKLHFLAEQSSASFEILNTDHLAIKKYLGELYQYLIAPVSLRSNVTSVSLLLDRLFQQVPFYSLLDENGQSLFEKYKVSLPFLPESVYKKKSVKLPVETTKNGLLAAESENLPMISRERLVLEQLIPQVMSYTGAEATVESLLQLGDNVTGFLHIAAHASRSSENPLFSRIMLTDGAFFPFDLRQKVIKAKLVTLSGCQTAAPGLNYGSSFSLARAFYQAGADFVVASLWPVNDTMTMIFMKQFYTALTTTHNIRESFTAAVLYMKEKTDDPIVWNAFVLLE